MKLVCLIPARTNSKRLKNKNFLNFNGKSLLEWSLIFSKKVKNFDRIIFSTDNLKIFKLRKKYPDIIFLKRPKKIAKDDTPMSSVIRHAINYLKEKGENYDAVALLQPTSPLRKVSTIRKSILKFKKDSPDYLASVKKLDHVCYPNMIISKKNKKFIQRKNFDIHKNKSEKYFHLDGGVIFIYKLPSKNYRLNGKGAFVEVKFPESIDINDKKDLIIAKKFFK
jgi:CMP-N-acetylneuraminic acid synthetase